jgi:two-component system, OmpR family, sensor kinase
MMLRRPRRPQLRTRVLAGVLLITVVALVAFDVAAVAALRGYLLGQTDSRLQNVLSLYRPVNQAVPTRLRSVPQQVKMRSQPPLASASTGERLPVPARARANWVIAGPRVRLSPPLLAQYYVGFVTVHGRRGLVIGNPRLVPDLPPGWQVTAAGPHVQTVSSVGGATQLRVRVIRVVTPAGALVATTSLAAVNSTVRRLELILIIASAVAGLLVAAGVSWVMRRGLRPIETMAAQADRITAGDLTDRVSPQDPATEVGRLGAALNGMLTRIEAAISEREASQELTRRFFADASHELRTPLASLRANAELYQQGALALGPQVDEAMRRIALEAQRMGRLVDDMLRLARLDQHPGQQHDPVDLTALIHGCAERAQIADPQRTWRTRIAAGLVVTGDEELLRRAVDNLLANVCAHTPAGTVATITAAAGGGTLTVEVSDDGPGVSDDRLPHIFDRFYRAAAPPRPGSGLGLAIVTAIAAAHQGAAGAALNHPHGLRVTLTLPAGGQPFPAPMPAASITAGSRPSLALR